MSNDRTSHVHPKQLAHRPPPSPLRGSKKGVKGFLRGPSWTKRSCRCRSSRPFAVLRPSWTKRSCRCRSSRPFVALRGQKEVAVAVLRGPSWPFVDKKKLPLPFFVALSGPSWTKRSCVAVLRGPSRPFADKKKLPLPFFAVLRGPSWTKRSCRCRSSCPSWPSAALRGQKEIAVAVLRLRGPSLPLPFFAALRGPSGQKEVAVAVLRAPSWKNHQSTLNNPNFSHRTPAPQKTLPQPRI